VFIHYASSNAILTSNVIQGNAGRGVEVNGNDPSNASNNATLSGNTIQGNNGGGIRLFHSRNSTITGNTITGNRSNTGGGIYFQSSSGCTVRDNIITGNLTTSAGQTGGVYIESSTNVNFAGDPVNGIFNRIHDNDGCNIRNTMPFTANGSNDIDARDVDWGTSDPNVVQNMICDFFDDTSKAFVLTSLPNAQVNGLICSNTTWTLSGSPYIVNSSVVVGCNAVLTIQPGVEVRFNSGLGITVGSTAFGAGTLKAQGTALSKITFRSNTQPQNPGSWAWIHFTDFTIDADFDAGGNYLAGSIIEHAIIEYAGSGGVAAVTIEQSRPYVTHTEIRNNSNYGIRVEGSGVATPPQRITNCQVWTCAAGGIVLDRKSVV